MAQQALALWKSQISSYQKIIQRCCNRILTPLTQFVPSDHEQRIIEFRQALAMKQPQSYQPYIDIIASHIQGKKNKSSIQLADFLVQQLGGSIKFWQNVILDLAQQIVYTPDFNVWQIRKTFQDKLYVDPEGLSNHRIMCKLAKQYISSIANLVKHINKFDLKKDNISKLDDLFKKLKSSEQKYISFSQKINSIQSSSTMNELSNNISVKSKQNALKDIYHFKDSHGHDKHNEKPKNTLLNYNFKFKAKQNLDERASGPTKNINETHKHITGERLNKFQNCLKNIIKNQAKLDELKQLFKDREEKQPENKQNKQQKKNYTTIWDKDYYFSFAGFPIQDTKFKEFTHPFAKQDWINYEINSQDQYQDLLGQDVDDSEISQVQMLSKTSSFVVSDDYFSDDENESCTKKQAKPKMCSAFGQRWSFQRSTASQTTVNDYTLKLISSKLKFPIEITDNKDQVDNILSRIVHGKDKQTIQQDLLRQKIKITKTKLKQFLDKKCKKVSNPQNSNKIIYQVIETEQENLHNDQKQNISRISCDNVSNKNFVQQKPQQDTKLHEIDEYFSQPISLKRMQTRGSKKQQSQKLKNDYKSQSSDQPVRIRMSETMSNRVLKKQK